MCDRHSVNPPPSGFSKKYSPCNMCNSPCNMLHGIEMPCCIVDLCNMNTTLPALATCGQFVLNGALVC